MQDNYVAGPAKPEQWNARIFREIKEGTRAALKQAAPMPTYPMHAYLSDLVGNRVHEGRCDSEDGGKPSTDCERCVLEAVQREMEMMQERLDRYREAGALSSLEVMPSDAAIERAARHMFSRSIGSCSTAHHREEMRGYDERSDANKAYWRTMAKELLRAAVGLPMEGV